MNMTSAYDNGVCTIAVTGKIDSTNYKEAEQMFTDICRQQPVKQLVLDFTEATYLSSAGLRVMLHLNKKFKPLQIINVSAEVYDIFQMTGFTEMMDIKKAYQKLDLTDCEIIGQGSNGIVYRYTEDIVVKVYKNTDALAEIQRERELARTALVLGVNTAISYDVVQVGEHYGSVFELLSAKNITQLILENPDHMDRYVKIFCNLLKTIHETEVKPGILPEAKNQYLRYADFLDSHLAPAHVEKLISLIKEVPDSCCMIHGDYHTSNVHYSNDEAILIDMDTLAVGNPVFEFASVFLAYEGFNELDHESSRRFMNLDRDMASMVWKSILTNYFDSCTPEKIADNVNKFRVLGYTRLLRRTINRSPEAKEAIIFLKEHLIQALDEVENLVI